MFSNFLYTTKTKKQFGGGKNRRTNKTQIVNIFWLGVNLQNIWWSDHDYVRNEFITSQKLKKNSFLKSKIIINIIYTIIIGLYVY